MKLPFSLWISAVFMLITTLLVPLSLGAKQKDIVLRKKRKRCFQNIPGHAHLSDPWFAGAGDQRRGESPHPKHPERQLVIKFKLEERWYIKAALFSFVFNLENPIFLTHPRDIFSITLNMIDLQVLHKHYNQGTYVNWCQWAGVEAVGGPPSSRPRYTHTHTHTHTHTCVPLSYSRQVSACW